MHLKLAAAKYVLGDLHSWLIPKVATQALEDGFYSTSLIKLIGWPHPSMEDVAPVFEAALRECGIDLPDLPSAERFIADAAGER